MNSNMTDQTEVALQKIGPISDLGPHLKVAQIRIENIRFAVICAVHTVMGKNRSDSYTRKKNWAPFACSLRIVLEMKWVY